MGEEVSDSGDKPHFHGDQSEYGMLLVCDSVWYIDRLGRFSRELNVSRKKRACCVVRCAFAPLRGAVITKLGHTRRSWPTNHCVGFSSRGKSVVVSVRTFII